MTLTMITCHQGALVKVPSLAQAFSPQYSTAGVKNFSMSIIYYKQTVESLRNSSTNLYIDICWYLFIPHLANLRFTQYRLLCRYSWDLKIGKLSKEMKILVYCRNAGFSYRNSEKRRSGFPASQN